MLVPPPLPPRASNLYIPRFVQVIFVTPPAFNSTLDAPFTGIVTFQLILAILIPPVLTNNKIQSVRSA